MPNKSEINFCEMWTECGVGTDAPSRQVAAWVIPRRHIPGVGCGDWERAGLMHRDTLDEPWHISPRGADLVASYEAAVSLGLEIVPDDAPPPIGSGYIDCDPDGREREGRYDDCEFCVGDACNRCGWKRAPGEPRGCECDVSDRHEHPREPVLVDCPECDDGWIGIPVAYGANGGVLRVWPATCPACKGAKVVEVETVRDIGRPLAGLTEAKRAFLITDGWQPLTHELAATLEGKRIEARSSGDPHPCTVIGLSPCAKWLRVDFIDGRYERAGALGFRGGWYVRVIDEAWVTEPAAMMALLEEARLDGFEVEVKATERPGGKSSHRKLGSGGPVSLVHAFSAVQAYVNFTWCAVAGYRGEYVGASPILTAVRRANGGRHGDA